MQVRADITLAMQLNLMHSALKLARNNTNMDSLIKTCHENTTVPKYTVGVFASGGLLDTIASIRAGFRPVWGTEICHRKRTLWHKLTGTQDLGDTLQVDWSNQTVPDCLISGMPCTDYSSSGSRTGEDGDTGHLYVDQCD